MDIYERTTMIIHIKELLFFYLNVWNTVHCLYNDFICVDSFVERILSFV